MMKFKEHGVENAEGLSENVRMKSGAEVVLRTKAEIFERLSLSNYTELQAIFAALAGRRSRSRSKNLKRRLKKLEKGRIGIEQGQTHKEMAASHEQVLNTKQVMDPSNVALFEDGIGKHEKKEHNINGLFDKGDLRCGVEVRHCQAKAETYRRLALSTNAESQAIFTAPTGRMSKSSRRRMKSRLKKLEEGKMQHKQTHNKMVPTDIRYLNKEVIILDPSDDEVPVSDGTSKGKGGENVKVLPENARMRSGVEIERTTDSENFKRFALSSYPELLAIFATQTGRRSRCRSRNMKRRLKKLEKRRMQNEQLQKEMPLRNVPDINKEVIILDPSDDEVLLLDGNSKEEKGVENVKGTTEKMGMRCGVEIVCETKAEIFDRLKKLETRRIQNEQAQNHKEKATNHVPELNTELVVLDSSDDEALEQDRKREGRKEENVERLFEKEDMRCGVEIQDCATEAIIYRTHASSINPVLQATFASQLGRMSKSRRSRMKRRFKKLEERTLQHEQVIEGDEKRCLLEANLDMAYEYGGVPNVLGDGIEKPTFAKNANHGKMTKQLKQEDTSRKASVEKESAHRKENMVLRRLLRTPRYFNSLQGSCETCYRCGDDNHVAAECSQPKKKKPCFICADPGHNGRQCKKAKKCYVCHNMGHISKDCDSNRRTEQSSALCLRCSNTGHDMFSCTDKYCSNDLKNFRCYFCNGFGHLCCFDYPNESSRQISCYICGQADHNGSNCSKLHSCSERSFGSKMHTAGRGLS